MLYPELVKEKKSRLYAMLKVGNRIPVRANGEKKMRKIVRVNHSRKRSDVITSITVIYGYAGYDGKPIMHKMDRVDIINNVFVDGSPYQWWYNKYYFYPTHMDGYKFDIIDRWEE